MPLFPDKVQKKSRKMKSTSQRELGKIENTPSGSANSKEPEWEDFKNCSYMVTLNNCNPTSHNISQSQVTKLSSVNEKSIIHLASRVLVLSPSLASSFH